MGFGQLGPIPQSAIREYAQVEQLTRHETTVLNYVIRALDNRQREIAAERADKQGKLASKGK